MRESVVTASLAEAFPALVEQILGGAGAAAVDAELERLPGLGAPVAACFRCELSVGALFGLELADGRRVALKVHQAHVTPRDVDAVQSVQGHLTASGLPCPRPVLGPTPFLGRVASAEQWLAEGEPAENVDPARRRAMARLLARQIELCRDLPAGSVLDWPADDDRLWGTPHNALFDFGATAAGAERIDEVARAALRLHRAGPRVLAHQDWSVKHFRWRGDRPTAIYDWDSLFTDHESIAVGAAAVTHTMALRPLRPWRPEPEDAIAFLDEYERARPLGPAARRAAEAHAVYSVAYAARCEHALAARGAPAVATAARETLEEFVRALLPAA